MTLFGDSPLLKLRDWESCSDRRRSDADPAMAGVMPRGDAERAKCPMAEVRDEVLSLELL